MLGDRVAQTLSAVGLTPERVERWLGRPCGCEERKLKLNALEAWARRTWTGQLERAHLFLNRILSE